MKVFIYSHTHWDREWYLSQNQFQYRLIRTVDEILDVLDRDPRFQVFVMDGQTSILEDYLELRPEQGQHVRDLIAAGRLVIGPWFTMPDTFLPDGESLIRNLLRGYHDCRAFGAKYPNVGYVPDSFGHIEQLPQILRGVGIDNFVFSRGRPASLAYGPSHRREFLWVAPDGTPVYACHLPHAYVAGMFLPGPDQPEALRQRLRDCIAGFAHSHRPDVVIVPHGIDHGWLQLNIGDILAALPALLPDVELHHGSLQDALDEWKKAVPADLESYRGQLRGHLGINELHGTLSSRIDNKIANEQAQMLTENLAEPLDAMAGWYGKPAAAPILRKAWRLLLHNHAHDSICGCSQDRVHEDVNRRFREATELAVDVADSALDYLNSDHRRTHTPSLAVYAGLNGGHRAVDFVLRLTDKPGVLACFLDERGTPYPLQIEAVNRLHVRHTNGEGRYLEVRGCTWVPDLAPCELRKLVYAPAAPRPAPIPLPACATSRTLDNGRLLVTVNRDGTLDLADRTTGKAVRGTHYVVQEADIGGGYHFEPLPGDPRVDTRTAGPARVRRLANGPLRASLEVETRLRVPRCFDRTRGKRSGRAVITVRSRLTLEADSDTVQVQTRIHNTAWNQRLRLVLPTGLATTTVTADAAFAAHENRPDRWAADPRQNSHPLRNAVAIAENGCELAFLGRGLHEYEIVPTPAGTNLEVTLLRSVDFVFLCSTWATPGARLLGDLTFDYALRLRTGAADTAGLSRAAAVFRHPAIAETHGDVGNPREHEHHATVGFYQEIGGGREIPVDTNRSAWKPMNANRDGWRRVEPERFVTVPLPQRLVPFRLDGEGLVVSALKRAEDGQGTILRFWSSAPTPQTVTVRTGCPGVDMVRTDLLERALPDATADRDSLSFTVRPFEIVTVRLAAAGGRPD